MKLLVVVLALASIALAEPEADPAYLYRGYYGYHPYAYRPYGYGYGYYNGFYRHSAYGHGLPNGYAHVSRVHKREADAQVVAPVAAPLAYNPLAYGLGLPAAAYHTPLTATVKSVVNADLAVAATAVPAYAPYYGFPTAAAAYPASLVYNTAPVATAPVAYATPAAVPHRPFGPRDCVTADGCGVRALIEAGLAKREAVAEPEADADADAEAYFYGYYGYPGIYNNYYGGYGYGGYGGYGYPYSYYGGYGYPYATYPYAAPVAAPVAPEAPAVEVKAVDEEPAVVAAPLPVAPYVVAAPAPVAVKPTVTVQKPVTYTHLGAHPIHPTTVLETTTY